MSLSENEVYLVNRKRVFEIYDYKCAACGSEKKITCHHIVMKSDVGSLVRFDFSVDQMSNLIPLCESCHQSLHKIIEKIDRHQNESLFSLWKDLKEKISQFSEVETNSVVSSEREKGQILFEKSGRENKRPSSFIVLYRYNCQIKAGEACGGVYSFNGKKIRSK